MEMFKLMPCAYTRYASWISFPITGFSDLDLYSKPVESLGEHVKSPIQKSAFYKASAYDSRTGLPVGYAMKI